MFSNSILDEILGVCIFTNVTKEDINVITE